MRKNTRKSGAKTTLARQAEGIDVTGPFPGFPVSLKGHENSDISAIIDAHRDELPFNDQLPTFDPPKHTDHRALLAKMIAPMTNTRRRPKVSARRPPVTIRTPKTTV